MSVTIAIPTYNRKRFEKLLEYNIACQTYTNCRVLILDDGVESTFNLDIPFEYEVIRLHKKLDLGQKRNMLCTLAKSEYIAFMDDDDIYQPTYIQYAMSSLKYSGKSVFGSSAMLITFPHLNWKMVATVCENIERQNEATLVFKKSFWKENKFKGKDNESRSFLEGKKDEIFNGDIANIMVCIAHDSNTVSKTRWIENVIPDELRPNIHIHKKIYQEYVCPTK